jgi:hypothetical protein
MYQTKQPDRGQCERPGAIISYFAFASPKFSSFRFMVQNVLTCQPTFLPPVSGILSGYQFTQGFAAANMSRLRAEVAAAAQEANRPADSSEGSHSPQF